MQEEVLRTAILRSQALSQILERDINALLNLKPTNLLQKEEMVTLVEQAKDEKSGLEIKAINENWKVWGQAYSKVLQKFQHMQDRYGEKEIAELFEEVHNKMVAEGKSVSGEQGSGSISL